MHVDALRDFCLSLPGATEDIKWGKDLCFLIGEKMFCVSSLSDPCMFSIKVPEDVFGELTTREGIVPAPYLARAKWIKIESPDALPADELRDHIRRSYAMIKAKLPKRVRQQIDDPSNA